MVKIHPVSSHLFLQVPRESTHELVALKSIGFLQSRKKPDSIELHVLPDCYLHRPVRRSQT